MFNLDSDVTAKGAKSDGEANSKPSSSNIQCYIVYVSLVSTTLHLRFLNIRIPKNIIHTSKNAVELLRKYFSFCFYSAVQNKIPSCCG